MAPRNEVGFGTLPEASSPTWARSILPAPTIASRQWSHALARRCREPARVAGFIEPVSNVHHIVMATSVGFEFQARELGQSKWRHYTVGPGELCLIGAGGGPSELCWQSQGPGRTLEVVEVYIDPVGLRSEKARDLRVSLETSFRTLRDPLVTELLTGIARELDRPDSDQELFGDLATTLLGLQLERAYGVSSAPQTPRRGGLPPLVLQRVREYVDAHLASAIRLQRLAELAKVSPFHFSRAFKASTGLSPHAYVLHCRIARAKSLLASTNLPVADIARRTGFSPGQLSAHFRASTGTTPSAFRGLARG